MSQKIPEVPKELVDFIRQRAEQITREKPEATGSEILEEAMRDGIEWCKKNYPIAVTGDY